MKSTTPLISVVGRRKQASSAILFRVLLFNRVIIEKAFWQTTNIKHIFSAKCLKREQFPVAPVVAWLPFNYFKIAYTYNFRGISRTSSRVWCCNPSLNKNSFGTDIICNLTRRWFATVIGEAQLELNFLFSSDTSLLTLISCCTSLNMTSLLPQYTSSNLTRKLITESMLATKIKNKRMPCGQRVLQR